MQSSSTQADFAEVGHFWPDTGADIDQCRGALEACDNALAESRVTYTATVAEAVGAYLATTMAGRNWRRATRNDRVGS